MSDHTYTPKSKFGKWFNDRLPLLSLASHLTDYPTPKNLNYWWTFGGILTFLFIVTNYNRTRFSNALCGSRRFSI
jgi:Cytochrome b subunit of the bc complex